MFNVHRNRCGHTQNVYIQAMRPPSCANRLSQSNQQTITYFIIKFQTHNDNTQCVLPYYRSVYIKTHFELKQAKEK